MNFRILSRVVPILILLIIGSVIVWHAVVSNFSVDLEKDQERENLVPPNDSGRPALVDKVEDPTENPEKIKFREAIELFRESFAKKTKMSKEDRDLVVFYLEHMNKVYDETFTWNKLPKIGKIGSYRIVLLSDNATDGDNFDSLKPDQEVTRHVPDDFDSHIGHFNNENGRVLYWRNKYKFKLYGDTEINEFGVCTDNGLVMRIAVNNRSGKVMMVRVKDYDNSTIFFQCKDTKSKYRDGVVTIDNNSKSVINWRQVFDDNVEPREVTLDALGQNMVFKFGDHDYMLLYSNGMIITM